MAPSEKSDIANRWWEYYFLRYFVGTVVGAVTIAFLTKSGDSALNAVGLPQPKDFTDWGIKEITGLAALGFAFCYIASTPMLLLHTCRALFSVKVRRTVKTFATVSSIAIAVTYLGASLSLSIPRHGWYTLGILGFAVVFGLQLGLIFTAHFGRQAIIEFYWHLARARAKDDQFVGEYVESYRHLREHGNAVAIVILEFVLALAISSTSEPSLAILAVFLWMLPSTYSWFVGSLLESRLDGSDKK